MRFWIQLDCTELEHDESLTHVCFKWNVWWNDIFCRVFFIISILKASFILFRWPIYLLLFIFYFTTIIGVSIAWQCNEKKNRVVLFVYLLLSVTNKVAFFNCANKSHLYVIIYSKCFIYMHLLFLFLLWFVH